MAAKGCMTQHVGMGLLVLDNITGRLLVTTTVCTRDLTTLPPRRSCQPAACTQEQLCDRERRFKQELLTQAKARRAFGEIRRIIDWAGLDRATAAAMAAGGGGGGSGGYYATDRCSSADSGAAEEGGGGPLGVFGGSGGGMYGSGGRAGGLSYSSPLHGQPSSGSYGGTSPRGHQQQGLGMLQEEEEGEPLHSTSPRQHARCVGGVCW
jgi:hypothetical protein